MKIRGTRECQSCGTVWSYYETGAIECPNCGSLKSVGTDEDRKRHTDSPVELDLDPALRLLADDRIEAAIEEIEPRVREYTRRRGFIAGGALQPIDATYLGAWELRHAIDLIEHRARPTGQADLDEFEQLYVLELVQATDAGERLPIDRVPESMSEARGAACTDAVSTYREGLTTWLDDNPDSEARRTVGSLRDHLRRAEALDGEIAIDLAEEFVTIAEELFAYLIHDDEDALASARDRLDQNRRR